MLPTPLRSSFGDGGSARVLARPLRVTEIDENVRYLEQQPDDSRAADSAKPDSPPPSADTVTVTTPRQRDLAAVTAGLTLPWSSGPTS
jgi:hypothetical protein